MGKRVALALLAVGLVAGLLFLLGVFEPETAQDAASDGTAEDGRDAALRARPGTETDAPDGTDEAGPAEAPAPRTRYRLTGRVTQPDGSPAVGARITVKANVLTYRDLEVEIDATTDAAGAYDVSVDALFDVEDELPVLLIAEATHPRFLTAASSVPVTGRDRTGESAEWQIDIALKPAAVLTGQLVHEDGLPVANGWVRLLRLVDGQVREPEGFVNAIPTDDDGRFRVEHAEDDSEMVLFGNAPGLMPATEVVQLHLDRTTALDPIVLVRGHTITGWLRIRGEPVEGMMVRCQRHWRDGARRVMVGRFGSHVLFKDGQVSPQEKMATTGPDGRFEISGLSKDMWHFRLHHQGPVAVHWDVVREHAKPKFRAPAKDVVIDLDGVWVTVHIVDEDGKPIPKMGTSTGGFGLSSGDTGTIRVLWPASTKKSLRVRRAPEFVTQEVTIETGDIGTNVERTVTMKRVGERPAVEITVEGEGADRIDIVGYALHRRKSRQYPQHSGTLRRRGGVFRYEGAPPGACEIEVRPDSTWRGGSGHFLPYRQLILVPETGTEHVTAKLKMGGRLALHVHGPDGRRVPAKCKVTDADGRAVRVFFFGRTAYGGGGSAGRLSVFGRTVVDPALPAGTYRFHLTYRGMEDLVLEGEVREGETTVLRGTMRRSK